MTYATQSRHALQGISLWQRLAALRADLADMGIHRGQIGAIARRAALEA